MKRCFYKFLFLMSVHLLFAYSSFAQLDSIFDQGVYRTFIVHIPTGYDSNNQYPLVVNLHGLNSNAVSQEAYSQFDNVADTANFIVVYPNAINGSWAISGNSDVNFISHLVDSIRTDYSCNTCLFVTGMSMGGFLTYKLACALPQPITAIAVVSGNMSQPLENSCVIANGLPVMHFHGTADGIVSYEGAIGIPPVDTTIQWWVNENNCSTIPLFTSIPDINLNDSSTAEKYYYGGGVNGSEMTFYKIINGGHTWPGAFPVPLLGNTNQDISASGVMGNFFQNFCSPAVGMNDYEDVNPIPVYPNPAQTNITIELPQKDFHVEISDFTGRKIYSEKNITGKTQIDCTGFSNGIYFVQATDGKSSYSQKIIIRK